MQNQIDMLEGDMERLNAEVVELKSQLDEKDEAIVEKDVAVEERDEGENVREAKDEGGGCSEERSDKAMKICEYPGDSLRSSLTPRSSQRSRP